MRKRLFSVASAIVLAGISVAATASTQYEFHQVIRGLVKAAPPQPACVDPASAAVGDISDRFCGHEGMSLYNVGSVGGRGILLSTTDDSAGARWGSSTTVDVPGVPTCSPSVDVSVCISYNNGPAYTAAMGQHSTTQNDAARVCLNKGDGWHLPSFGEMNALSKPGKAVYDKLNMLPGNYWPSAEAGTNVSWGMTVGGGRSTQLKTYLFPVRCARTY